MGPYSAAPWVERRIPVPGKHLFSRTHPRANEPQGKKESGGGGPYLFSGLLSEVFGGGGVGAKRGKWAKLVAPQRLRVWRKEERGSGRPSDAARAWSISALPPSH